MQSSSQRPSRLGSPLPTPTLIAVICVVLAIMTSIWAIVNHNRVASLEDEAQDLRQDISVLRENANSTAYVFEATDIAPPNLQGVAFIRTSGSGAVAISNLPPAGDNDVYQLWLVNADDSATSAGALITNENGQGFALIPADSSGYTRIAISLEQAGATQPSGEFLLTTEVNPARGIQPGQRMLYWQRYA